MEQRIQTAEVVAVGTELTTGATRDTNAGDLARELTTLGLVVLRMTDLPDDLTVVTDALRAAMQRADIVLSSGGLGPTPDDLTREAIAAACDATPVVDPATERWLESLFARRGIPMAESNRKQAWLIPGATTLRNGRGTAPGWWVERPDGGLIVALPGPPAELWPMWRSAVLPRLRGLQVGDDRAARTLRLTGVGESALVGMIGEDILRAANPQVATYARADAVDVRVSAVGQPESSATELVDAAVAGLRERLGDHVFAEGEAGWPEALADVLGGRLLATCEIATGGQLAALLDAAPFMAYGEVAAEGDEEVTADALGREAERVRALAGADVGLAVHAVTQRDDTRVRVAISTEAGTDFEERTAFLTGPEGRRRAAIAACGVLWRRLRDQ
ncbi:CinA family nicotinamide mononucleotide deamidase-related protein [soil metagenome]